MTTNFQKIKKIVDELNDEIHKKIKLLDITNTFTENTCQKYMDDINGKKNVMLFVNKTPGTKFIFDLMFPRSAMLLFFDDDYVNIPQKFNNATIKLGIKNMIKDNNGCTKCHKDILVGISCMNCSKSFCQKCVFELLEKTNTEINESTTIKCPDCSTPNLIQ